MPERSGPLQGVRVLEFASLGPGPHCAMMLADLGASVLTVDRAVAEGVDAERGPRRERRFQTPLRGRAGQLNLDLRTSESQTRITRFLERTDVLIEGFRPGAMERLGFGPDRCLALNPRLIYVQVTGWGSDGPWSLRAGHDINYIATSGLLSLIGARGQAPVFPLNLLGDYGGGSMLAALGIASALFERERSGRGQVLDIAMTEGAALLGAAVMGACASGDWNAERGSNLLDGGAPWYRVYETSDGRYMAVGALEEKFYVEFVSGLGLEIAAIPSRGDYANWPHLHELFASVFRQRTGAEWAAVFEVLDACVTPVLSPAEALQHPQATSRSAFVELDGVMQPAPTPRFSRTPGCVNRGAGVAPGGIEPEDW
ncbi:CaiB/BaiF CoA-transferase family protein [soil metagenome]